MKKILAVWLLCLTGFYSNYSVAGDFKPSSSIVKLMPIVINNLDILDLTPQQMDEVRKISRESMHQAKQINAEYHLIKSELAEYLLEPSPLKQATSAQLLDELAALDRQRMQLTVDCAEGLKKVLGADLFTEIVSLYQFKAQ